MLALMGHVHVAPRDVDEFLRDLQALALDTRASPGCLFYAVAGEDATAGRLLVAERWRDQAALTAHLASSRVSAFLRKWAERSRGELVKFDVGNERSLLE